MIQLFKYTGKKVTAAFAVAVFALCPVLSFAVDFDLYMQVDRTEVRQGEPITFTVTVQNRSGATVAGLQVVDSLSRGVAFISSTAAGVTTGGRNLIVNVPTLQAGESYTFDLTQRTERRGTLEKQLWLRRGVATVQTAQARVEVLTSNVLDIQVTMFTPNGDGVNDYFEIPGLLSFPNNELVIFNRFSDVVYRTRGYTNNWDAAGLPDGNYFYILTLYLDNGVVQKYNGPIAVRR